MRNLGAPSTFQPSVRPAKSVFFQKKNSKVSTAQSYPYHTAHATLSTNSHRRVIMGGNAAKERRRLKRLEADKLKNTPQVKQDENRDVKAENKPKPHVVKKQDGFKSKQKTPISKKSNAIISKSKFDKNGASKKKLNNKIKKPKHLARKMHATADPKEMEELLKKQNELQTNKAERSARFKEKVIEAVGGKAFFDEQVYDTIMEQGGSKMESIIEAVKISDVSEERETKKESLPSYPERDSRIESEAQVELEKLSEEGGESVADDSGTEDSDTEPEELQTDSRSKSDENDANIAEVSHEEDSGSKSDENGANIAEVSHEKDSRSKNDENDANITEVSHANDSDSDSDISSDSDAESSEDEDVNDQQTERTRGRKRKGRKEADARREELNTNQQEEAKRIAEEAKPVSKKTSRAEDKRRCIGRKALTDFKVGQQYTGTVRYVKPNLGLFIDIGCHSDAFCHISRASDEFLEVITDDMYKTGDVLEDKVRIVDIDRAKKRITVSLQSDERKADEVKSASDFGRRLQEKKAKKRKLFGGNDYSSSKNTNTPRATKENFNEERALPVQADVTTEPQEEVPIVIDPDNMSPAELKRARKLLRRQERRIQQELTGISA
jgi:hypothetical protein